MTNNIKEVLKNGFERLDSIAEEQRILLEKPITKLSSDRQDLQGLKFACELNEESDFNSLEILLPIARQMVSNMHSKDLLEFIELRHQVLSSRLNNKCFNVED